jgi:hypothetical protein
LEEFRFLGLVDLRQHPFDLIQILRPKHPPTADAKSS